MYWPLKPPVRQEIFNFDLDFSFIITTCAQFHTSKNHNKIIVQTINTCLISSKYQFLCQILAEKKNIMSVWGSLFPKYGMRHGSQIKLVD